VACTQHSKFPDSHIRFRLRHGAGDAGLKPLVFPILSLISATGHCANRIWKQPGE
jgi:hypothetical protein